MLAGFYAYNTVAHDGPSHAAMTDHRNWAIATIVLFLCLAVWSIIRVRAERPLGTLFVVALVATQLVLLSTAWRGGELVYRHGLGVLSLPVVETMEHGHGPADEHLLEAAHAAPNAVGHAQDKDSEHSHSDQEPHGH